MSPKFTMLASKPSRTAQAAAMYRAAHQCVDTPRIFEDPLALRIVGRKAEKSIAAGAERWTGQRAASMRAFVAARSRYAEDRFAFAFGRSVRQYVVLGAGLDTFAYRTRFEGVYVFELDQPATQVWKRERLVDVGIAIPEHVAYVPIDFERESMLVGLRGAGFDFSAPVFFAWLGVTPYLTRDAILGTLEVVAQAMQSGSEVVFDFAARSSEASDSEASQRSLAARVAAIGEPFKSAFDPTAFAADLSALAFSLVEVADTSILNRCYFAERADGLCLRGGNMMCVRV